MTIGKWIGGFLGFINAGPLGALAGIALGALFDMGLDRINQPGTNSENINNAYDNNDFSPTGNRQNTSNYYEGQRNSFLFSLLVLASYVIRADGRVMHSEMETLRHFLRNNFGRLAVEQGEQIILNLFEQQKHIGLHQFREIIHKSCIQISKNMDYSQRLQLLNFLTMLAKADGQVVVVEIEALRNIAIWMGLNATEVDTMLNLKKDDINSAYKVLAVSPSATDEEIKKAYRKMALEHHPDRVAALGEDIRLAAEKKFQEINEAKERIYRSRGLS
ncbi:DnaJ domain protein [Hoylesella saccharolytica F0055]|uniref:DnaJ domain protein n=1 Tax=Hoylesella saccharolytica F0055 TaxID=1127699 RepID=L1N8E4_9BACT|nr:DnaJ domain-containing protein [Hoylesella saccharolytica]EKX99534.1 DnaJ domain protein [Hoylesella saccharolytica F0055]